MKSTISNIILDTAEGYFKISNIVSILLSNCLLGQFDRKSAFRLYFDALSPEFDFRINRSMETK